MTYGLQILPDDGGKAIDISSDTKTAAYLGYFAPPLDRDGRQIFTAPLSVEAQLFVIPRKTTTYYYTDGSAVPRIIVVDNISVSGATVIATVSNFNKYYDTGQIPGGFDVFQIMGSSVTAGYGLFMQSSTDFSAITDAGIIGQCVYRAAISFSGVWSIPADIPDRDNCIVYAHWDNSERTIYFDRKNMQIEAYRDGGETHPADCSMEVIIFSNGTPPVPPSYGLAIWNARGQCTFSSRTAPMIWNGNTVRLSSSPRQYTWPEQPVKKLAVPLCCSGADTGESTLSFGYKILYNAGLRMAGNAVCGSRARQTGITYPQTAGIIRKIASVTLPVIDASFYL